MLGQEALPEGLVAPCLDVLRKLSTSERDLIRLVVEIIQELRDLTKEAEPEVRQGRLIHVFLLISFAGGKACKW